MRKADYCGARRLAVAAGLLVGGLAAASTGWAQPVERGAPRAGAGIRAGR